MTERALARVMPPIATRGLRVSSRARRTPASPTTGSGLALLVVSKTGADGEVVSGCFIGFRELFGIVGGHSEQASGTIMRLAESGERSSWPTWRPSKAAARQRSARSLMMSLMVGAQVRSEFAGLVEHLVHVAGLVAVLEKSATGGGQRIGGGADMASSFAKQLGSRIG